MPEEVLVNRVRSVTVDDPGRSLNSARTNHFVIDEPPSAGGPGEALTPAEAFLAGVSACGVLLVQGRARETGIPLQRAEAVIEGIRRTEDLSRFETVRLRFDLAGPTREQAEQLVEFYKGR